MSKLGNAVPSVDFKYRVRTDGNPITFVDETNGDANPFDWKTVNSSEIFEGKKVVVFSLPGAFTPTCSTYQVPGFEGMYEQFKAQGVEPAPAVIEEPKQLVDSDDITDDEFERFCRQRGLCTGV